jgi:hypothetical protein
VAVRGVRRGVAGRVRGRRARRAAQQPRPVGGGGPGARADPARLARQQVERGGLRRRPGPWPPATPARQCSSTPDRTRP